MIKQKIQQLRKNGYSYNEISNQYGISKTYARKVSKHIIMSKNGKERYHNEVTGIVKRIKPQKELTQEKIRIIGNLLFDGAVFKSDWHYIMSYVNTSKELVDELITDMNVVYGVNPTATSNESGKYLPYYRVKYSSKLIYEDLFNYMTSYSTADSKCKIKKIIMNSDKDLLRTFLQTFWTNEGSVSNTGKLSGDSKSKRVIYQLSKLHKKFGILHYMCSYSKEKYGKMYKLCLNISKENYLRFFNLNLFGESIITKGNNIGKKKQEFLKSYMTKRKFL